MNEWRRKIIHSSETYVWLSTVNWESLQVLPYIFMKEMDIKKTITKIDIYSWGKYSIGKVRAFNREPNLSWAKGWLAKVSWRSDIHAGTEMMGRSYPSQKVIQGPKT